MSVLSHTNPVHALPIRFLKIHFNIILLSTSSVPSYFLPHQTSVYISLLPPTFYMPCSTCPLVNLIALIVTGYGPGSSFGIATGLRAGRSGDRIAVGRDFPPVQTGPGAHPASCTMGTRSFQGVKSGRCVMLTTHPLLVPRSWKSRAIPLPTPWATTGPQTGTIYL